MTRTKSMIYAPSEEARELTLVACNDGDLYRRLNQHVVNNLKKHFKKGRFDENRAVDACYRIATAASDQYYKDYGYKFTVTERFTAAVDILEHYREQIEED